MANTTTTSKVPARGVTTIHSDRPECHANSGYSVRDYSAKPAKSGVSPREVKRSQILAFWESQGVARRTPQGTWEARDILHDGSRWLPLASRETVGRSDVIELSHVISTEQNGAWCACNLLPENGATNAARGSLNIPADALNAQARHLLRAWRGYWLDNLARKESRKRLGV